MHGKLNFMKNRSGFVSNSSSSSFIISLKKLTALQLLQIQNHIEEGKKLGMKYTHPFGRWNVTVDTENNELDVDTTVDNFDMHEFLILIGVKEKHIKCGRDY